MKKTEIKSFVSKQWGFKTNQITLLETSAHYGELDYVMFEVCGIQYQARKEMASFGQQLWDFEIYKPF